MQRLHRSGAVFALLVCLAACRAPGEFKDSVRPNIIVIMTDDQGYGDFGFQGNPVLETPHLDALQASCPDVRRFYVSPVCSPTRASLLTGRYNYRTRVVDTWIGRSMMEPQEVTLAEALGAAGYRNGIFGKWHLGDCYPLRPMDQGFDESLVHRGGGLAQPSEPIENQRRYSNPVLARNGELVQMKGYCTDVYFDAALEFIDESLQRERPFFCYVATNAPHDPLHDVPEELYQKYRQRDLSRILMGENGNADKVARIYAMIENIDQNIGRLLDHLEQRNISEHTIVVFLGDNGPSGGRFTAGLRGSKASVYEGGIRSPLLVRWPGHLSPDTVVEQICAHIDLMPTLLDAAGVEHPHSSFDGRSVLPLLEGRDVEWPERHLVIQSHRGNVPQQEHQFAVIGSRWKLLRASGFGRETPPADHPFELYDLPDDSSEQRDMSRGQPAVVQELRAVYRRWFEDVSGTRADNYDPPRIVIGSEHQSVTHLTRQDWQRQEAGGWGLQGSWLVDVAESCKLGIRLLFLDSRKFDQAVLRMDRGSNGTATVEWDRTREGTDLLLGRVKFQAGEANISFECRDGDQIFAPYQVILERCEN